MTFSAGFETCRRRSGTGRPAMPSRPTAHIPMSWPPLLSAADGLLFHSRAVEYLRALFIAWLAANDVYWPHEKRLDVRLRLMRRDDQAALEEDVWAGKDLNVRLSAIDRLGERLLNEMGSAATPHTDNSGSATI